MAYIALERDVARKLPSQLEEHRAPMCIIRRALNVFRKPVQRILGEICTTGFNPLPTRLATAGTADASSYSEVVGLSVESDTLRAEPYHDWSQKTHQVRWEMISTHSDAFDIIIGDEGVEIWRKSVLQGSDAILALYAERSRKCS